MRKPNPELASRIKKTFVELLKEKDASSIGMRELAEKCGITAANIYHYYKNKDEIIKAINTHIGTQEAERIFEKLKEAKGT